MLILIGSFAVVSFVLLTVIVPYLATRSDNREGILFGAYALYRLAEFIMAALITVTIPLDSGRLRALRRTPYWLSPGLLFLVSCPLTSRLSRRQSLAAGLAGMDNPGPWLYYLKNPEREGLGTIGYNHTYPGCQMILLFGPRSLCYGGLPPMLNCLLALVILFAVFLTGSRVCFLAMLLLAVLALIHGGSKAHVTVFIVGAACSW